ncbi:UDP-2,4-diacetamido-2,4,6-trideoxy-beta-L-altropyranose hydrolase [Psychrobacillus sp. FSL H8-0484]|uniref:UDP-2,4-diacetamido-2,4, 6-trideoxy-beta-L-altropyranose hydrolase n=1 Tax=Psychrobacillus sp. FSL H8-0484 TaxID=2921390 RepID=UPI0030F5595D
MQVLIRVDSSIKIGTGHVMRCLTLANQLKSKGLQVLFVCRELEGNIIDYIQLQGFSVHSIPNKTKLEKAYWLEDVNQIIQIIKSGCLEVKLLIVDHYELDKEWEEKLRPFVKKIMVIDDLANRSHDCDILLDQNYYVNLETRYQSLVPKNCVQLLGPNYALLRDEFLEVVNGPRERTEKIENILVFFGGTDPTGETVKTLEALRKQIKQNVIVSVVVGASNPKRNEVEKLCHQMPNTIFHCQVSNMAELMQNADLAIGAGGSTTWERCFLRLPSITIIVAENQHELTEAISTLGTSINLGISKEVGVLDIENAISNILSNPFQIKDMSINCSKVMDQDQMREYPVLREIEVNCL